MKQETKDIALKQINILKSRVKDSVTYEHIVASILEIYIEGRDFLSAMKQIAHEVPALNHSKNEEVFDAVFILSELITSYSKDLRESYAEEIANNELQWEQEITGEVYDFIHSYA